MKTQKEDTGTLFAEHREEIDRDPQDRGFLPSLMLKEIKYMRRAQDRLEDQIRREALASLPTEQQREIRENEQASPNQTILAVFATLKVSKADNLPWHKMGGRTTYIAEAHLKNGGDPGLVQFTSTKKNKAGKTVTETLVKRDSKISFELRPKVSKETRSAFENAKYAIKRTSPEYARIAQWGKEYCRKVANTLVRRAQELTGCEVVVVCVEDLNVKFFNGKGKRAVGWDNLFTQKRENRWFIKGLHKALTDLGPNRGVYVLEVDPRRTSRTCPNCEHCDEDSRNGESFVCTKCGWTGHADRDVGAFNIEKVGLTGKTMPKPEAPAEEKATGKSAKLARASVVSNPPDPLASQKPADSCLAPKPNAKKRGRSTRSDLTLSQISV